MADNAKGAFEEKEEQTHDLKLAVNSIQQTVFVERLPNPHTANYRYDDVIAYDKDNLYPNKIKSMAQRSQSTISAVDTLRDFTNGQGDEDNGDTVINEEGQTLNDIIRHAASEKSMFRGFVLHFDYNAFGEITAINEVPFETIRWSYDYQYFIFDVDWYRESQRSGSQEQKRVRYHKFNPDTVLEEIEEAGGIENYKGQILYYIPKVKEIYTVCRFDQALDDVQFEHESGLYKLRNIQNDYSAGHIMLYPQQIESEIEKIDIANDIRKSRGANNAGRVKGIPVNASTFEAIGNRKLIEEIPRTGIDKLFTKQNEETRFNIFAAFNQPPILNGISKDGMFNSASFVDAFDYYNSKTEADRQEIEKVFNKFLPYTVFNMDSIEIQPLEFMRERENGQKTQKNGEENNT